MKVVRLSALRKSRLYPPGYSPGTHFCLSEGLITAGKKSMRNPNIPIGNRTRDLPACGAVHQKNAPPRTAETYIIVIVLILIIALVIRNNSNNKSDILLLLLLFLLIILHRGVGTTQSVSRLQAVKPGNCGSSLFRGRRFFCEIQASVAV
jgi:hypothetical protein